MTTAMLMAAAALFVSEGVDRPDVPAAAPEAAVKAAATEVKRIVKELDALPALTREAVQKVLGVEFPPGTRYPHFEEAIVGIPAGPFQIVRLSRFLKQSSPPNAYREQVSLSLRDGLGLHVNDVLPDGKARPGPLGARSSPLEPDEFVVDGPGRKIIYEHWPGRKGELLGVKVWRLWPGDPR
jgi:hypothetical protein